MSFDFWNNPLVVSALRLKYRRSSPGILASLWALGLLGVGALLYHSSHQGGFPFSKTYLLILLSIQFIVCGIVALISATNSMNAEVINRTLDFQRIVSLSPQAILVGKAIGEPAISYFLAAASLPFAALCWGMGAASGLAVLLFYLNLATFIFLAASLGLIHSLTPPVRTVGRQRGGAGGAVFALLFIVLPQLIVHGVQVLRTPGLGDALNLLTPIGSLAALWDGNAWNARVTLWGVSIPALLAAPVVQLATASWIIAAMSRRLKNPNDPAVSKQRGYATMLVLDLVFAGVCYANWRRGVAATPLIYGYLLAHVIGCLLLLLAVVPRRTAVMSWIWRRDPKSSAVAQSLFAERSDVRLAGLALGALGPAVMAGALYFPMSLAGGPANEPVPLHVLVEASLATVVIVYAAAALQQLLALAVPKAPQLVYVLLMVILNIAPVIATALLERPGQMGDSQDLSSLSPVAYYSMNMWRLFPPYVSPMWLLIAYVALGAGCTWLIHAWIRGQSKIVQTKLHGMRPSQAESPLPQPAPA